MTRARTAGGLFRRIRGAATAVVVATLLTTTSVALADVGASGAAPSGYMTAAEYFGEANPFNFWSSNLSTAPATFAQMRSDGFNTVALIVPWGEFEPGVEPPTFNQSAFQTLDRLVMEAGNAGLGVILRLSYSLDVDPNDQMAATRDLALFSNTQVYDAWLDYISEIHQNVAQFSNVRGAYISWEDFWNPVLDAQAVTTESQQLSLARSIGFQSWLRKSYSLKRISKEYGESFTSWSQIGTPPASSPAFSLMFQFEDWVLVHRLFEPALKRFPGLTMETRVDVDPIYSGQQVVGSYTHTLLYRLLGTKATGMYFSPYMGDPSPSPQETSAQALSALETTLSTMSKASGGHPLVIYEYEVVSNAPEVADDPALPPSQVGPFITQSESLMKRYTKGYALWTYRDYNLSPVYNPSFVLGTEGWTIRGRAVAKSGEGTPYLAMSAGATATPTVAGGLLSSGTATLSFEADASSSSAQLTVRWGGDPVLTVPLQAGWQTYQVTEPVPPTGGALSLGASTPLGLTDVQLYTFTQEGDTYSVNGTPEAAVAPLQQLNDQLTGSSSTT